MEVCCSWMSIDVGRVQGVRSSREVPVNNSQI
jgi:hypothetical protein